MFAWVRTGFFLAVLGYPICSSWLQLFFHLEDKSFKKFSCCLLNCMDQTEVVQNLFSLGSAVSLQCENLRREVYFLFLKLFWMRSLHCITAMYRAVVYIKLARAARGALQDSGLQSNARVSLAHSTTVREGRRCWLCVPKLTRVWREHTTLHALLVWSQDRREFSRLSQPQVISSSKRDPSYDKGYQVF